MSHHIVVSMVSESRTEFTVKAQYCTNVYDDYVESVINNRTTFDEVLDFFSGTVRLVKFI